MFSAKDSLLTRPSGGYQISRSLRFNSPDSAYLNRTPATTTNRTTFTWSGWIKRTTLGGQYVIYSAEQNGNNQFWFQWDGDEINIYDYQSAYNLRIITNALYRDPSAWYHVVFAVDTTQATASNRIKLYVNGVQVTSFSTETYPSQNYTTMVNYTSAPSLLGSGVSPTRYLPGYMTEVNFIDGQALTPSSFGSTNADTGVWQPKAYSGSYGTNGFYLNFSDNSNTTAATLGADYSGNGNNWTPNNFSVSAGAGNDSLVDSPTSYGTDTGVGGSVRGNYCTLNPLTTTAGTYTQGNLRYVGASNYRRTNSTVSVATGQWYWEVTLGNAPYSPRGVGSQYNAFGFGLSTVFNSITNPNSVTDALVLADNSYYKNFSGAWTDTSVAFSSGDVLSIAVDLDGNTFTLRRNNTSLVTGTIGGTVGRELTPIIISYDGTQGVMDCNFGQRPFAYTAPSGFKALCTQNLPTPTIGATSATLASQFFAPVTYAGTSATQSVTVGFQPDFVWIKNRTNGANWHVLTDSVRGIQKELYSNSTTAEGTLTTSGVNQFNASSFQILGNNNDYNGNTSNYVAWNWRASNATAVSNTSGSITSTVSASTTSGFSVVTYASTTGTVGHGLGVVPSVIIMKGRNVTDQWAVYHISTGNTYAIPLNSTGAGDVNSAFWSNTTPTSTVFSQGSWDSGYNKVAYCFAPIAGYSAFGSYTGNGSADGPFVFTGFRPAFVMVKRTDSTSDWYIWDTKRDTYNVVTNTLEANTSDAEASATSIDDLSNGFKCRSATVVNASGGTYIYMAFAEAPQKFSLAR